MEKVPQFIKGFSKEESRDERDKTAQAIKSSRQDSAELNNDQEAMRDKLNRIANLDKEIEEISSTLPKKLANYFSYRKKLAELRDEKDILMQMQDSFTEKSKRQEDPEKILQSFYSDQRQKWEKADYKKEDLENFFNPEHLAVLDLQEYITLLKRFPSHMVTHVTRQGIRDHVGGVNHYAGYEKYSTRFTDVLEDGFQKSQIEISLTEYEKQQAISRFISLPDCNTKEEAIKKLDEFLLPENQHSDGAFGDLSSIHFATEEVADDHYGSERGNEIFFAYPSALIASQFHFSGQLNKADGGTHNNQWVFTENDNGLDIDTGIVFIPKHAQVSSRNGSKYELTQDNEPILDENKIGSIREIIKNPEASDFFKRLSTLLGREAINIEEIWDEKNIDEPRKIKFKEEFDSFVAEFKSKFGRQFDSDVKDLLTYEFAMITGFSEGEDDLVLSRRIADFLTERSKKFILAKDAIPSEEYWNTYFESNPDKKPSKIVFYEGEDPTKALRDWRIANGLVKKTDSQTFSFDDRSINLKENPIILRDKSDRFRSIALEVIDNHFDK